MRLRQTEFIETFFSVPNHPQTWDEFGDWWNTLSIPEKDFYLSKNLPELFHIY